MVKLYVRKIKEGTFTLEQVPPHWYEDVKAQLIADGFLVEEEEEEIVDDEADTKDEEAEEVEDDTEETDLDK